MCSMLWKKLVSQQILQNKWNNRIKILLNIIRNIIRTNRNILKYKTRLIIFGDD